MYTKKVLIFNQVLSGYATKGRQLCGMVKVVNNGNDFSDATVFITNADTKQFGEWYVILIANDNVYVNNLTTLNNATFSIAESDLSSLACLLINKFNDNVKIVAEATLNKTIPFALKSRVAEIINSNNTSSTYAETPSTPYETFLNNNQSYYNDTPSTSEVENLKATLDEKFKSVNEYSTAFERYYATGRGDNYYKSVMKEITKLFVEFPPYYPLINKYKNAYFVRINFPQSNKYFVLGLVEKDKEVKYICYGLPAELNEINDKDFVFVASEPVGFYMLCQDAETGQLTAIPEPIVPDKPIAS